MTSRRNRVHCVVALLCLIALARCARFAGADDRSACRLSRDADGAIASVTFRDLRAEHRNQPLQISDAVEIVRKCADLRVGEPESTDPIAAVTNGRQFYRSYFGAGYFSLVTGAAGDVESFAYYPYRAVNATVRACLEGNVHDHVGTDLGVFVVKHGSDLCRHRGAQVTFTAAGPDPNLVAVAIGPTEPNSH